MAGFKDEFGGDDPEDEGLDDFEEVYESHRLAIYDMILAYGDDQDLSDGFLSQLISDIGLSLRMVAYASETEKPSVGGLRLDLDRYTRELGDSVREAKKGAAEFIAEARQAREDEERAAADDAASDEGGGDKTQ
ncbi:hypothetical protein [Bosea sp. 117]|uniref:hypothetical protein n=1 Tax=Bosea sp. 117 TaxID=1125973 RepID=UPI00068EBC88|nr:hypothetical protein [Bosea sp. 117]